MIHLGEHYLADELNALAAEHDNLTVELITPQQLPAALDGLRLLSRQTMALLCGSPGHVETFARRLYLSGLPRNQLLADVFVGQADLP